MDLSFLPLVWGHRVMIRVFGLASVDVQSRSGNFRNDGLCEEVSLEGNVIIGWEKYWIGFLVVIAIRAIFFNEDRLPNFYDDEVEWDN